MGKFKMRCSHADHGGPGWWEDYDKPTVTDQATAEAWATETMQRFNRTLRSGEVKRVLHETVFLSAESDIHNWTKTSLVTLPSKGRGSHDMMQCRGCGITGKRYGLHRVAIDNKYRAKVYQSCAKAKVHLAKREAKRLGKTSSPTSENR